MVISDHPVRLRQQQRFRRQLQAHENVIKNEAWYGDGPPELGDGFTAEKANEWRATVVQILDRAAKRTEKANNNDLAAAYDQLAEKLEACGPKHRCGSPACPLCARAFQRAKVAAQSRAIKALAKKKPGKKLVMATVVPLWLTYPPSKVHKLDIGKLNRWLKDALKTSGFNRIMIGSADISWEPGGQEAGYYQLHWHLVMWTAKPKRLSKRLKKIFRGQKKHDRPVEVTTSDDLGFIPYLNKVIKMPKLLRTNRRYLPELLLVLDRTDPLDFLVMTKMRIVAQDDGLSLHQKSKIPFGKVSSTK